MIWEVVCNQQSSEQVIHFRVVDQPLRDQVIRFGIRLQKRIRELRESKGMDRVKSTGNTVIMREMGTEDDVKLTLIIDLSAELDEVCVNRRRTVHLERPHRRQIILIAKASRLIRVQMGKRTESNDPISSQQHAEHDCGVPSHRLTDRDQTARLYGVNQG